MGAIETFAEHDEDRGDNSSENARAELRCRKDPGGGGSHALARLDGPVRASAGYPRLRP